MTFILVTGSRTVAGTLEIAREFDRIEAEFGKHGPITLMHGGSKVRNADGTFGSADYLCGEEAKRRGWTVEQRDAKWTHPRTKRFDPTAGFTRNAAMVKEAGQHCGAGEMVLVVAFLAPCAKGSCRTKGPHRSHGAQDTVDKALAADLPVRIVEMEP